MSALESEVAGIRWYHTLELPGGVLTPGEYDLRPSLARVPLPARLDGMRCLDVGTHDGFWAFEMERRGAREVTGIDLEDPERYDWPAPIPELTPTLRYELGARRRAFSIAHQALHSAVDRRDLSVYDLHPDLVGSFDFAVIGTLLLHLRDPVAALMAIRRVVTGHLLVHEAVSLSLTVLRRRTAAAKFIAVRGVPFWWVPNVAGLRNYVRVAGFDIVSTGGPYLVANGPGFVPMRLPENSASGRLRLRMLRRGSPHAWVLARPAA